MSVDVLPGKLPWENTTPIPDFKGDKAAYRQYHSHTKEVDCMHFSGFEGINSSQKVGFGNDAYRANGLVADWDAKGLSHNEIELGLKRLGLPPTAWNKTFSGGARAVWVFEKPIFYHSKKFWSVFVEKLGKNLKLKAAFAALDADLLEKPEQTYVAGTGWHVTDNKIAATLLSVIEFDAAAKATDVGMGDIEIPFEVLEAEIQKKFPGRWSGPFQEGSRGVRFWISSADNPTGVFVRKTGCTCFTGNIPFVKWADIFGHDFVRQYRESREGAILTSMYSGTSQGVFYIRNAPNWAVFNTDDTKRYLKSIHQISDSPPKGRQSSEVDDILMSLKLRRNVNGALPFPHRPEEVVEWCGNRYINTADVRLITPASEPGEFPWLQTSLNTLFPDRRNREHWTAWLKVWYESCLRGFPCRGQAIFVAGPPGTGKTFFSRQVVGKIFGGYADASGFLVEGNNFNSELFSKVVWCIDDSLAITDRKSHARFSSTIKAAIANDSMPYNKKYGYSGDCPFSGRPIINLNPDPTSLGVLPDTDQNLDDKINLYLTGDLKIEVAKDERERYAIVERELPFFLRWLVDTPIAPWIEEDARYGIKSYHDPVLLSNARENSPSHHIMTAIDTWRMGEIDTHKQIHTGEKIKKPCPPWHSDKYVGELAKILNTAPELRGLMPRAMYPSTLGKIISREVETGAYPWLTTTRDGKGTKLVFTE